MQIAGGWRSNFDAHGRIKKSSSSTLARPESNSSRGEASAGIPRPHALIGMSRPASETESSNPSLSSSASNGRRSTSAGLSPRRPNSFTEQRPGTPTTATGVSNTRAPGARIAAGATRADIGVGAGAAIKKPSLKARVVPPDSRRARFLQRCTPS